MIEAKNIAYNLSLHCHEALVLPLCHLGHNGSVGKSP